MLVTLRIQKVNIHVLSFSALSFLLGLYPPRNQSLNVSYAGQVFYAPYNIQQVCLFFFSFMIDTRLWFIWGLAAAWHTPPLICSTPSSFEKWYFTLIHLLSQTTSLQTEFDSTQIYHHYISAIVYLRSGSCTSYPPPLPPPHHSHTFFPVLLALTMK